MNKDYEILELSSSTPSNPYYGDKSLQVQLEDLNIRYNKLEDRFYKFQEKINLILETVFKLDVRKVESLVEIKNALNIHGWTFDLNNMEKIHAILEQESLKRVEPQQENLPVQQVNPLKTKKAAKLKR